MGMTALKPGVCTTIQDLGRFGCQASGFSPSGAMDARAAKIANILVDNPITAPVLESVSYTHLTLPTTERV